MTWSLKHIEQLKKAGKIAGYSFTQKGEKIASNDTFIAEKGRKVSKHYPKISKEKDFIARNLLEWCQANNLQLQEEFKFHETRRWRFDWCIESVKLAIEYNGIMSKKSRHTTVKGYTGDMNKINAAQALGWRVLQFTPLNYTELLIELNKFLC